MSSRQAVVLASRVLCVYFLYTAFGNVTTLPFLALNMWHQSQMTSRMPDLSQWAFRSMTLSVEAAVLRLAVELLLAIAFYQCGPRVARFLTGEASEFNSSEAGMTA